MNPGINRPPLNQAMNRPAMKWPSEPRSSLMCDAFNSRDVDKLVSLWSPNGVYTSRTTGEATVGREAMTGIVQGDF